MRGGARRRGARFLAGVLPDSSLVASFESFRANCAMKRGLSHCNMSAAGAFLRGPSAFFMRSQPGRIGSDRICTPRPARGTRESKSGGLHHQDVRGHRVHDELGRVADEEALETRARHDAHRDDGAAFAPGGARDGFVRPALPPGDSGCASRRSRRPRGPACAAPPRSSSSRSAPTSSSGPSGMAGTTGTPGMNACSACSSPCSACTSCAPARRICRSRLVGLANACEGSMAASTRGRWYSRRFLTSSTGIGHRRSSSQSVYASSQRAGWRPVP